MSLEQALRARCEQLADTATGDAAMARLHALLSGSLPRYRQEAWRHTDPDALWRSTRLAAGAAALPSLPPAAEDEHRVVFVDGRYCAELSTPTGAQAPAKSSLAPSRATELADSLAALSAALAVDGLRLRIDGHQIARWRVVSLLTPAAEGTAVHLDHQLEIDGAAELVFEQYGPPETEYEIHQTLRVRASGSDAHVRLLHWQGEGTQARVYHHWQIDAHNGEGRIAVAQINAGGGQVRGELACNLRDWLGDGLLAGQLNLADRRRQIDNRFSCIHHGLATRSSTMARSVAAGRGKAAFDGLIRIVPGASGSDGQMQIAGLLLDRGAEIDAKPTLIIEHDDVKCAHGATCGALDEAALHYLRSRGIPLLQARALLLRAFAAGAVEAASGELSGETRDWLWQRLDIALRDYVEAAR